MTDVQNMMLAVCFGVSVGFMAGNIVILIQEGIHKFRQNKRKKKDTTDNTK